MESVDLQDGEKIFEKGETAEYVYILKSGGITIKFFDYEETIASPIAVGLEALIGDEIYSESCYAKGETKLLKFTPAEFKDVYISTELGKNSLAEFIKRTAKIAGWL